MPIYKYKATKEGKEYEDSKEVADKQALYDSVRKDGGLIVSVKEVVSLEKKSSFFSFIGGVKMEEKINFAKNLAVMIEAGLSINRAISIIQKQTKNKKWSTILKGIIDEIDKGKNLSDALKGYPDDFSNLFCSMVKSGEESGKISVALRSIANQLEKNNSLARKIKGAMIYPSIVISIMIIIGALMMIYMVPTLAGTFKELKVELPLPTRIVVGVSDFMIANLLLIIIAVILLIFAFISFKKSDLGKRFIDNLLVRLPIISPIAKEFNAARTTRTMSSLMSSGVDIVSSLSVTRDVLQNSLYKKVIDGAIEKIKSGGTISSVFMEAGDLYPVFVGEMIAVGEETGTIASMLDNVAVYYETEIDQKTKDLSTVIEPVLMVLIGIMVGGFAITMLLPTYSLVDAI